MARAYIFDRETKDSRGDNMLHKVIEADDDQELEEELTAELRRIEPEYFQTYAPRRYRVIYAA